MDLPRYHKRAFAHNYHAPFIYHIILKKMKGAMAFGAIGGDARIPYGTDGCAYIKESALGSIIAKKVIEIQKNFPILQVYQFCVMPDHVHILLRVKDWSTHHLDYYIEYLKATIASKYSQSLNKTVTGENIFEPGYCDKPLLLKRSLDTLFHYIRQNPHRLAMRQQYPEFFQRTRNIQIGDNHFEGYGNLFLLRNPDKEAVKISRKDSPEAVAAKTAQWLDAASRGTVLVSPFISPKEKEIRNAAEAQGAFIILVTHEAFPERFKPSARDFTLCCAGKLLILSLGLSADTPLTREICQQMNTLSTEISKQENPRSMSDHMKTTKMQQSS